jgi:hypothetical protein
MALYLISSRLYKDLIKYCNNKNIIKEEFNKKIKEFNFEDENEVNYFLNNYKNNIYDKNNLMKYIELLKYFRYDNTENIIIHIFETYFFDDVDNIIENEIIEMIKIILSMREFKNIIDKYYESINIKGENWTKNKLNNFSRIINITELNLSYNKTITDEGIKDMIQIQKLNLSYNEKITDGGIKNMIQMQNLNLTYNNIITDIGIKNMVQMQNLNLLYNNIITDIGIKNMVQMQNLNLLFNYKITDECIKSMIQMQNLNLTYDNIITT